MQEENKTLQETADKTKETINTIGSLRRTYDSLKNEQGLAKDEQKLLNSAIAGLGKLMPDAIADTDRYGNAIKLNEGRIREYVKVLKEKNAEEAKTANKSLAETQQFLQKDADKITKALKLVSELDVIVTSIKPVLVGEENPETVHEPSLYSEYCLTDVNRIAEYYGVSFSSKNYPEKSLVDIANSILAAVDESEFISTARLVSKALWNNEKKALEELSVKFTADHDLVIKKLNQGNTIRNEKGYYFGSAFYYGKELYWGVDRIHYLEARLNELGLRKGSTNDPICIPNLKAPEKFECEDGVNFYYYPSLNSPYTFVSAKGVKELSDNYPINLITKPVLPMLMRKMTIPSHKVKYILSDAAREGVKKKNPIGNVYSPIGKPAKKAYSIFPIIDEAGKGFEYINELGL